MSFLFYFDVSGIFGSFFQITSADVLLGLVIFVHKKNTCPKHSMYGVFSYTYHENKSNVGKYTIH